MTTLNYVFKYQGRSDTPNARDQVRSGMGAYAGAARRRVSLRRYSLVLRLSIAQADARPECETAR